METQSIVFTNTELDLRISGLLRLPDNFDLSQDYPAIVVDGSMLSLKEQVQSTYAEKLTELGYVTLVFDRATLGASEGMPRQQELIDYNVTEIMKGMAKPYLVISGENAWSKPASTELFEAVPGSTPKEMHVIGEAGHFDLYDLAPYVPQAFGHVEPFFAKNL